MLNPERYETIAIAVTDGIAVLTLNRPERLNAVNDRMHSELSTIFQDAQEDAAVNVVVLTGAGRAFSAGGDTSPDRAFAAEGGRTVMQEARHIIDDLIALEKPLIAAVNGHAIGLGATLATLADVSYMARPGRLGDPHVRAALPAGNGSAVIWPLLIGVNKAKQLLMTGAIITAAEAQAIGLISEVVDDGAAALESAMTMARELNAFTPHAVRGTKAAINRYLQSASALTLPGSLAVEEMAMQHPAYAEAIRKLNEPRT